MKFGEMLEEVKKGKKARNGLWNGKNAYIYYVPGRKVDIDNWIASDENSKPTKEEIEQGYVEVLGHIDMKTNDNKRMVGWLISQYDLQSDAWEVVE